MERRPRRPAARATLGADGRLSDEDRHIVRLLQEDGRLPLGKIAQEVGLNIKTVRNRVRELRDGNYINITTVTDPELLGYRALALVGIVIDHTSALTDVGQETAGIEAVDHLVTCTGRYDMLAEVVCRDMRDLHQQIIRIQSLSGVARTEMFPYLSLFYQEPHWEARRGGGSGGIKKSHDLELNSVDEGILTALNEDGRVALRDVARRLTVSEGQVRQRFARMVASGGVRVLALTNPRLLGIQMAWLAVAVAGGEARAEIARRLAALDVVTYVVISIGRFDVWAEVSFASQEGLLQILDEQVAPIAGIDRVEVCMYLDIHYRGLRPAQH
jgi:Lrp/AsnC family transcriptional regulator for asnA, asnC and gidA